jgi:hypothetical protein
MSPLNRVRINVLCWATTLALVGVLGIIWFNLSFSTWLWWPYGYFCLMFLSAITIGSAQHESLRSMNRETDSDVFRYIERE